MRIILIIVVLFLCNYSIAQQTESVDFLTAKIEVHPIPLNKEVRGIVSYKFKVLKDVDSIYIDARNMKFANVHLSRKKFKYKNDEYKLWLFHHFKKDNEYTVSFNYEVKPKKAIYFIDWEYQGHPEANPQVWTQGQGKDNSNWIPSFDDMNEKVEFDLTIMFDENYEVISNGTLIGVGNTPGFKHWKYNMKKPMSSYLLALAIGKYDKKTVVSKSGIPLEMYYYPKDSSKVETTYRYSKKIFEFLENEIGVKYPWQNYKQIPVKDFLYAGMENTSTTIFSDSFVVDSTAFVDKNYVNINAHELAHQWFGDLVTETHGTHHWLQEGFATYYALLVEKNIFGEDYYYNKLYQTSQQLLRAQKTDTIPLLNPKASSLTFYQKGAWALHCLREQVGDIVFKKSVKKYLDKHKFKNVETEDFISIIEKESKQDLSDFVNTWLLSNKFSKSNSINMLNSISSNSVYRNRIHYKTIESSIISDSLFTTSDIKIRQILAEKVQKIPENLKPVYESLLKDNSYQTIESALYNLWVNFKDDRIKYLNITKDIQGFNDKNVRVLWLALALNTKGFETNQYKEFYIELVGYTFPIYHFEVRQNAFLYLEKINGFNDIGIKNLEKGTKHHNWKFSSFCKKLLLRLKA